MSFLLGEPDPLPATAHDVGFLPIRLGGLGLFAAERIAPAAYWAAWADALPVLALRQPILAARCAAELTLGPESAAACLREAAASASDLDRFGWQSRPGWAVLAANASEVPNLREREPGIPAHGWQHLASLVVHTSFRAREVLPRLPPAGQALLRSQAGPHAGAWLTAIPSEEGATLMPTSCTLPSGAAYACLCRPRPSVAGRVPAAMGAAARWIHWAITRWHAHAAVSSHAGPTC